MTTRTLHSRTSDRMKTRIKKNQQRSCAAREIWYYYYYFLPHWFRLFFLGPFHFFFLLDFIENVYTVRLLVRWCCCFFSLNKLITHDLVAWKENLHKYSCCCLLVDRLAAATMCNTREDRWKSSEIRNDFICLSHRTFEHRLDSNFRVRCYLLWRDIAQKKEKTN